MKLTRSLLQRTLQLSDDETAFAWRVLKAGTADSVDQAIERYAVKVPLYPPIADYVWHYGLPDIKLHVVDRIARGVGVEFLPTDQERWESYRVGPEVLYLNSGDAYKSTLMYRRSKNRFFIGCWAICRRS